MVMILGDDDDDASSRTWNIFYNSMWEVTLPNFQWIWKARNWQTGIQVFTTNRGNCMTDWILQMEQLGS
jgi:hypothetical protein